jgi:hypothetical protein
MANTDGADGRLVFTGMLAVETLKPISIAVVVKLARR